MRSDRTTRARVKDVMLFRGHLDYDDIKNLYEGVRPQVVETKSGKPLHAYWTFNNDLNDSSSKNTNDLTYNLSVISGDSSDYTFETDVPIGAYLESSVFPESIKNGV